MFVVSGPGPAITRASNAADINALLAAVSGQKTKFAAKTLKGKAWPKYYGIQPTAYPDEPFVKELYYNNASTGLILSGATKVPPQVPHVPPQVAPTPPHQEPPTLPPVIDGPGLNNLRERSRPLALVWARAATDICRPLSLATTVLRSRRLHA